jgi:NTP pyrophosphatase (non-canonical NTP hydrolase)
MSKTQNVLGEVALERVRQDELQKAGKFAWTCATRHVTDDCKLKVLVEEIGEVARALCEGDRANLREELVQCAAVCVAWCESLEP